MPSSKNRPGPRDRNPLSGPEPKCVKINSTTKKRCNRNRAKGTGGLCRPHFQLEQARLARESGDSFLDAEGNPTAEAPDNVVPLRRNLKGGQPEPTPKGLIQAGETTKARKQAVGALVITEQARDALRRLGQPVEADSRIDPKQVLLESVRSAHTQRQIWEQMLAQTPEADWDLVGTPAIPGSKASSRGVRIEVIQKNLDAATKSAARISKLAIDAGIEERLVKLAEQQEALIADTIRAAVIAAIGSLNLSPTAEAAAIDAALGRAATHLRQLAATAGDQTIIEGVAVATKKEFTGR